MKNRYSKIALCLAGCLALATPVSAASEIGGERYIPGIWVDPDGCQHWVLDDGVEGFMSPVLRRDGTPVCEACLVATSDQLFQVDKAVVNASGRARLEEFFRTNGSESFTVTGHTDSDASHGYNQALSERRARAVAAIASSVGARVNWKGYGETRHVASNATAAGKAQNRRVEIICNK